MIRVFLVSWMALTIPLTWSANLTAQEAPHRGRPLWHSFDVRDTGAMPETHAAAVDERGLIYAANDSGLLSFDGSAWRIHPAGPGKIPLNVLAPLDDGAWLAGGGQHLGVFVPTADGTLKWTDLGNLTAAGQSYEVLALTPGQSGTYVITDRNILTWKDGTPSQIYSGVPTGFAFVAENNLVASIEGGLIIIDQNGSRELSPPPGWDELEPIDVLHIEDGNPVLVTKRSGLFTITLAEDRLSLSPLWDILPIPLESVSLSAAARHRDGAYILGTENGGTLHLDRMGNPLRMIDERSGFRGGTVRAIIAKPNSNTFVFHDGGMIWLDLSDEQRIWDKTNGLTSPVTAIAIDAATTYAGTGVGLFRSLSGGRMRHLAEGGNEPIHTLSRFARSSMKGHTSLLVGRESGVFEFFDNELTEIVPGRATALFISRTQPSRIAIGIKNLVRLFEFDRGEWRDIGFLGRPADAQVSDFTETGEGDLLIAFSDSTIARYAADDWLGEGNLADAMPLATQSFPRRIMTGVRPQFASSGDKIHLFASGAALLWDYRATRFSTDTALTTALAVVFGANQPRWLAASRNNDSLWFQTNVGTFVMRSGSDELIALPDIAAGTARHGTIFLDESSPRTLVGTPDGLLSLPTSRQEQISSERLPELILRGISVDRDTIYQGNGTFDQIHVSPQTTNVTLTFSVLDWLNQCGKHDFVAEVRGLHSGTSYLPLDRKCRLTFGAGSFETENSTIEIRFSRDGAPVTKTRILNVQSHQPWFTTALIHYVLAVLLAIAALAGGLKPRRVWPEPLRRYLALLSGLLLCLAVALSLNLIPPPASLPDVGRWIIGLAFVSFILPLFAEAVMRLSDRRHLSG
ncbi:MAG: hypothetical protein HN793_13730 [Rhodospirillaceae bacterium]|jgi:hypothetical protein|nr:hypothetical protein [Rhodospirillaceae bacterium]MBT5564503.1 hypothetical protein [Rhodospirillaceae bacterium]MBT6089793.1 hypothetical protein [Rhodospirillaceae bacterium]MBT7451890.1 hypothetical protein [Rhodospirillaceae bacterium]